MKKVLLLMFLAGSFAACKKEYTCQCMVSGIEISNNSIGKLTKKEADKACDANDNSSLGMDCTAREK